MKQGFGFSAGGGRRKGMQSNFPDLWKLELSGGGGGRKEGVNCDLMMGKRNELYVQEGGG